MDTPDPSNQSNSASSELIDESTTASIFGTDSDLVQSDGLSPSTTSSFPWPFREACSLRRSIVLNSVENRTGGFEVRGWGDAIRRAVVIPIVATPGSSANAVIVIGLNTRRPFDESIATFIQLISRHLSTGLSAVEAFELETKRAQESDARVQERTRELIDSEARHVQAAEQRAQDAEERKAEYEKFVDMTSHELRNPLSAVWQLSESLYDSLSTIMNATSRGDVEAKAIIEAEVHECIEVIASLQLCIQHQRRICDDILSVSRLGMGLLTLSRRPFDIASVVKDVVKMFSAEARHKGMSLDVMISETLHQVLVVADEGRLTQVVLNFLGNALKAGGGESICINVELLDHCPDPVVGSRRVGMVMGEEATRGGGEEEQHEKRTRILASSWLLVSVRDGGRGMTEADMSRLFSRFAQVKPSTDQYGGAGLGLFICRRLIELHDGFIEVSSEPECGSTFAFCIPTETRIVGPLASMGLPTSSPYLSSSSSPLISIVPAPTPTPMMSRKRSEETSGSLGVVIPKLVTGEPDHLLSTSSGHGQPVIKKTLRDSAHILVVEDNLINLKVLTKQLTKCGYVVHQASNGREGLDIVFNSEARGQEIDFILMDNEMPVMDGLSACRELRRAEASGQLKRRYPIICVTGNARHEQKEELLGVGFDSISTKPYDFKALHAGMQALMLHHDYTPRLSQRPP